MISYAPFWKTLKQASISTYVLINKHHINPTTIQRLRHNQPLSTNTLADLGDILECRIQDIVEFVPTNKFEQ